MLFHSKNGQGESLIKILVVAIIAIIALAIAKSYFQKSAQRTQETVEEVFAPETSLPRGDIIKTALSNPTPIRLILPLAPT
ncbi:MAG: hypothetical protein JXB14_02905 [Candidatus Altiarchaeota archaeon]|nr:hypothetical protein [Candidatus Altiarchaeota archaeon]